MLQVVVPYTFFLLGPPVTLTAGWRGLPLYLVETLVLAGLVWLTLPLVDSCSLRLGMLVREAKGNHDSSSGYDADSVCRGGVSAAARGAAATAGGL
jgi:hypothetical protein